MMSHAWVLMEMEQTKVSKQQHPHVVLQDWEPLLLVVRVHDADHPGGVEAGSCEAGGEGPPGEALPVELLPLPLDQPPHVFFGVSWGAARVLHQVQVPVGSIQSFLCFILQINKIHGKLKKCYKGFMHARSIY